VHHYSCSWFCPLEPDFHDYSRVLIQFDVETISPFQQLATRPLAAPLRAYIGEPVAYYRNQVGLFLSDDLAELFVHNSPNDFDEPPPMALGGILDLRPFEPTNKMTVVTEILVGDDGLPFEAQRLHFDVATIPEPGSALLFVLGCVAACARKNGLFRSL
jgi:hypothetical protein